MSDRMTGSNRGGRRFNRRFARHVLSVFLVLNMLLNTFGQAWGNVEAFGEAYAIEPDVSEVNDLMLGDLAEYTLADDFSLGYYSYELGNKKQVLLSAVLEALELPFGVKKVEMAAVLGAEMVVMPEKTQEVPAQWLSIEPTKAEADGQEKDDYLITVLADFSEAGFSVYTKDETFIIRLTNYMDPDQAGAAYEEDDVDLTYLGDVDDLPGENGADGNETNQSLFTYNLAGSGQAMLSEVMAAALMPIGISDVELTAPLGMEDGEAEALSVLPEDGDYEIVALRDFDTASVAVYTSDDAYTILLVNGRALVDDATEDATADESPVEHVDEPVVEQEVELGGDIDEPVAEQEIELGGDPEGVSEDQTPAEPAGEPEAVPENGPAGFAGEPEAVPENGPAGEPGAMPENEAATEPDGESGAVPEVEIDLGPEGEPENPSEDEAHFESDESLPGNGTDGESAGEPDVTPEDGITAETENEPEAVPEVEIDLEPADDPEAAPEVEADLETVGEHEAVPEDEPNAKPAGEPAAVPEDESNTDSADNPEAVPEVEIDLESAAGPEIAPENASDAEPIGEPEAAPEDEPSVEPITEPEAAPEDEPSAEPIGEPKAAPEDGPDAKPAVVSEGVPEEEIDLGSAVMPEGVPEDGLTEEPDVEADELPAVEPVVYPAQSFVGRVMGVAVTVEAGEGAFPEGTTMKVRAVRDAGTLSGAAEAVTSEDDFVEVSRVYAVDITFYDAQGNEIEPLLPISVVMSVAQIEADQEATVVHVDDAGNPEVVEQGDAPESADGRLALNVEMPATQSVEGGEEGPLQDTGLVLDQTEVAFDADSFSTYVIVITETIQTRYIDAAGNTYSVEVSYDAGAGIPAGAQLRVEEIAGEAGEEYTAAAAHAMNADAEDIVYAKALDISILSNGNAVQPDLPVQVSVRLLDAPVSNEGMQINVVHFGDEVEMVDCSVNGESIEFEAEGFSVYVLISSGGNTVTPQHTYTFWVPNDDAPGTYKEYALADSQGRIIYKQTITTGDELIVPQPVSSQNASFVGWFEGNTDGAGGVSLAAEPYDFDNIVIEENGAIDLYAVYQSLAVVVFHDQYDSGSMTFPVAYTRRAELATSGEGDAATASATLKISDLSTTYTSDGGPNMAFYGWSETPVTTPGAAKDDNGGDVTAIATDEDGCITVTGEKHLYPIFKEVHRLTYYTAQSGKGADYVPPADYFVGEALPVQLPVTSMDGYAFDGWYTGTLTVTTEGNGTVETVNYGSQITHADGSLVNSADNGGAYISDGKLYLRADTTLYAKWVANAQAAYRVVVLKQDPSDADGLENEDKAYVYAESAIFSGVIGEFASVPEEFKEKAYQGYSYSWCDAPKPVTADGGMTLNVYYDKASGYAPEGSYTLTFADSLTETDEMSKDLPVEHPAISYGTSLADMIPADPASGRNGYEFSGWYYDQACTIPASLNTMPDHDLTVYAGWETGWYLVTIDPNYGALYSQEDADGTGATWFWSSFEGEPIGEYNHTTRDFVESSSGTWYYVNHSGDGLGGDNGWPDRHTYYTQNPALATEDTTFEYAPGAYTYAGWYEVYLDENGNEIGEASEPYDFSRHTDHNTMLRLHWKRTGTFYLAYDAGEGRLEDGTQAVVLPNGYADYADIVLTQSANAPAGTAFVGWQVRGGDGAMYMSGQSFTLHAEDAKRVSGKDIVYLDAVYAKVGTASIVYDANGGAVEPDEVDFGKVPSGADAWENASGAVDEAAGTATVSGLSNNSKFKLSDGSGFIAPEESNAIFLGWSDQAVCDDSATFYPKGSEDIYGVSKSNTLYAVWGAQVTYFHGDDAQWGEEAWDPTVYALDEDDDAYSQSANIGAVVSEPADVPVYSGEDGRLFRYWATRSGEGTTEDPYVYTEYDFSQPVTGALDLYACWSEADTIAVHAVDASDAELAEITVRDGWTVTNIKVSVSETELNGTSHVTAPENYEFAFVAAANDLSSLSQSDAVTAIQYEDKAVKVKYAGDSRLSALGDRQLYFVYYKKKALEIGYKSMGEDGVLHAVDTTGAPADTGETLLGTFSMASRLSDPMSFASPEVGFTNYAFAIGDVDSDGEAQMNASNLSLITNTAGSGDPIPTLKVRNTWRGFEYTTQDGDAAEWTSCGYAPQLYVIYYSQQPTVVVFDEKTVGASAVMDTSFTFDLLVTQNTTTTVSVQTQVKNGGGEWENSGDPAVTTTTGEPETVFDTTAEGNQPYILRNGEGNSSILFHSASVEIGEPEEVDADTRTVTTTTTETTQTAVITQAANDAFTTAINEATQESGPYRYTYTANGSGGTQNVTFTNTHKAIPVEVHVAMVESNGTDSGIIQRDGRFRSVTEAEYRFDLAIGSSETLLTRLPSSTVFSGDGDVYAFGAVLCGSGSEEAAVAIESMEAASIAYERTARGAYELVLKDSDGNMIGELGSNQLYYLYYPMPRIRYVKEAEDGTLTDISGCLENQQTGNIEESDSVTYSHTPLTMNGLAVTQDQGVEIPLSGLIISQSGNHFRMPPVLDDGLYERYLGYVKIGAGDAQAADISRLDLGEDLAMQLKVQDNTLQYSFDGTTWKDLLLQGTPTIYAIYAERGYDLQLSKTVDMSRSGENAIFSGSSFIVTISSTTITKDSYDAEGTESSKIAATPSDGVEPGTITLTVVDGTRVRIKGLGRGEYTVTESGNENYTLTARTGSIVGSSTSAMAVADNTTISFALDAETRVDLTNTPKAICKVDEHYFYTLQSMIEYVDENISTKMATAEMLTDYVMPLADTVEIPSGFHLTLTTADSMDHVAVITRTAELAAVPLFTTNGALTLTNLVLEGSGIEATAPMIRSAGDLTVGTGATIQNAIGAGAISATSGDITVNGAILNCSAEAGGAIFHSGNSAITIGETAVVRNNIATSGSGGAIHLMGGTVKVSGTSIITGNRAESGNGGAIYAENAVIEIDQGGSLTDNAAREGGAIYAETGTIIISETENVDVKPAITGNTATTGSGGAVHVGTGSVSISGGSISDNKAENGQGGAIYANNASVEVSQTASVMNNTAKEGGAVYAVSGAVAVSGGTVESNTASTGNGGAVYAGSGSVTVSGGSLSENSAVEGNGGAIHAGSGNVTVSGGSVSNNTAKSDGGAIFAQSGAVTLSAPDGGAAPALQSNTASSGKGGAVYANSGAVSIAGIALTANTAGSDGGAVYAGSGAVTVTNSIFGGEASGDGNTAGGNGGALYADSGNLTVSGGSMKNNRSTGGNGGALYVGRGTAALSTVTLEANSATAGNGGAVCLDSGSLTLTGVTAAGNSAINGAAVYDNTGRASFDAGSYTGNVASNGGAVGVGSTDARLVFNGNVQIKDNRLGTEDGAPKSNVYLDRDDDTVINIDTLGSGAAIGIYVPDAVVPTRSVPGARFAVYTSNSNAAKISNDRFSALTVQSDTSAKKLYWGNSVRIEVMYRSSYAEGLPNGTASGRGSSIKDIATYYPTINSEGKIALSELAADVYTKNADVRTGLASHPNAAFGGAFYFDAPDYSYDISMLVWNRTEEKWQVEMRNGQTANLSGRIYVIYTEPAYLSIENNTDETLNIGDLRMTVNGSDISVINRGDPAGYGLVFAKNGAIRTALLPITAADLTLAVGQSINLLIPGGQNMPYQLDGSFETAPGGAVRLRRGAESSLSDESVTVSEDGSFAQLTGSTLNAAGTYNIIFGNDKVICKVVDAAGVEHPYSKISAAISDIVATTGANPPYSLATAKTATIEMVTDYLLPASDVVVIPKGYNITITTAATTGCTYNYTGEAKDGRATISRDSENTNSMISSQTGDTASILTLRNLIIDGKSVRGNSAGGAVSLSYFAVVVEKVDFVNVFASNGGALYIDDHFNSNSSSVRANSTLTVSNCKFSNCNSTLQSGSRIGGGAIHFFGDELNMTNCAFENCNGGDQAGAVFHRVDGNYNSWTNISGCTFINCSAKAAGGMELDSKTIIVKDTTFEHCVATERNGGGFNAYMTNSATPGTGTNCTITLTNCSFNDCQAYKENGGGFRSTAIYTTVNNCTFTNTSGSYGGGIAMSNTNAIKGEIYGCKFDRCTAAGQGGGVGSAAKELIVGDYTYTDDGGVEHTVHTEINNCTSSNEGGGLYHGRDVDGSSLTITNATISGNRTTASGKAGGGVYTNARTVKINGSAITDNSCTSAGGGVYAYSYTSLTISDSDISRNNATGNGGGVWFEANNDTNRAKQVLTIKGSTIDGNTSNSNGGGIYTLAKTVTIGASETKTDSDGKAVRSSVSNNTAKNNGGGIYQNRNVDGSSLTIDDTDVNGNTANNTSTGVDQGGGGIYAGVRTLRITNSTISHNTAKSNGGGILFEINNNDARNAMSITVSGSTLDNNTSGNNGGGIYTLAKTVEFKAHTEGEGEEAVKTATTISNCKAQASGGGIYHSRNADGSVLNITDSKISGCSSNDTSTAWDHGGGGVFAYVKTTTVTDSEISGNSAKGKGGGIVMGLESNDYMLTIDHSRITGNTSDNQGGGIATRCQLTLRNNTEITGNRLTSNTAANCAGVYLNNNRTLFVGSEDASEATTDTVIVRNNTTANGTLSDLRLWEDGGQNYGKVVNEQEVVSAYVYCNLSDDSEIRVVNAAKVSTWFGNAAIEYPNGFSDDNAAFRADSSTLHGIIDRTDPNKKKIIWAGPPIAKLTDAAGRLLYIKYTETGATYPAIFDRLDTGNNSAGSTVSPFNMLRMSELKLYYKDGSEYAGTDYCIKMLVETYETAADMTLPYVEGRNVTFTTAEKSFPANWPYEDGDTYHFEGRAGGRATVIRAYPGSTNRTLMNVNGNLTLENIIIDGGTENGIAVTGSTRCMWIDNAGCTVVLGENAVLQNGHVNTSSDGGGVYINNGTFKVKGGVIRNCTARNGGGIYKQGAQTLIMESGSVYQCTATSNGGGVYLNNGSFDMSGGTLSEGQAGSGGGVYVVSNKTVNMSGGSIVNNRATTAGGGIAIGDSNSRLNFSGKVNVSGNTCAASVATNQVCNVELNKASYSVINTQNGGLLAGSYIGVYVNGTEGTNSNYDKHGVERKPFGTFAAGDNITNFYSFVNDRNGLKGGIIEQTDANYVKNKNCIYWIQIFSLRIGKEILSSASTAADPSEAFLFKVNIRGNATVSGQLNAAQINSSTGEYGEEMRFTSNGIDTTTAVFALKDGESVTGVNLSEGLTYEVIEYLTLDQAKRYAAMPMNAYSPTIESLTYDGATYQVIKANTFTSTIGENKSRTDVDPYTSALTFTNLMPVCKITDMSGNVLYRRVGWDKVTNKAGEGPDGGNSVNQPYYYAPAVFTELTGEDGAFKALEGTLYTSNSTNPISYDVSNGVKIQMLVGEYSLDDTVEVNRGKVTLTTASSADALFPKQDAGTTSTIRRAFEGGSMFTVTKDMTLATIILDGAKRSYPAESNGGIINVASGANLTVQSGATLQNSKTAENGGAVYVDAGGAVTMTGGTVNRNESDGDGAGIYLAQGSVLMLSGDPGFGGTGLDVGGNIVTTNGNFKSGTLVAKTNGGKNYTQARQDIFIAGYAGGDGDSSAASLVVSGDITSGDASIWVWADEAPHYRSTQQFARIEYGKSVTVNTLKVFRNGQDDKTAENDTGSYLYGITKDGTYVLWNGKPVCKLTDSGDALLYERIMLGSRYVYNPAVYSTVAEGFAATNQNLFYSNGNRYSGPLKLKMLQDYELGSGEANISYETAKDLTFTTAETKNGNSDNYYYTPAEDATGERRTKATLTRTQTEASMFTISSGRALTVSDLVFDGSASTTTAGSVHGGAFNIVYATSASFSGVTFNALNATGNGGAISYTGTTGTLAVADSTFSDCYAAGNGGAIYTSAASTSLTGSTFNGHASLDQGTKNAINGGAVYLAANSALTMSSGSMTGNSATGKGGAVYLEDGASMAMSGGEIRGNAGAYGAVGVGGTGARLYFSGGAKVQGNTMSDGTTACNVYLDQDTHGVINASGLNASARIGVYAEGDTTGDGSGIYRTRGDVFDDFGSYTSPACLYGFVNDRNGLTGQARTTDNRIVWLGLASLEVTKRIVDAYGNIDRTFSFAVSFKGREEGYAYTWADGANTYSLTEGTRQTFTIAGSNGKARGADGSVDIGHQTIALPVGTEITLEESGADVGLYTTTMTGSNLADLAVSSLDPNTATFAIAPTTASAGITVVNTRKLAQVTLAKALSDPIVTNGTFAFTTSIQDNGAAATLAADIRPVGADGSISDKLGSFVIDVTDSAGSIAFMVPVGAVLTVREALTPTQQALYTTTVGETKTDTAELTVSETQANGVSFTNTRKTGDLSISKQVDSELAADGEAPFEFTVTLIDTQLSGSFEAKKNGSDIAGGVAFSNGTAKVTLKHDETIVIKGLPINVEYTVAETANDDFETTKEGDAGRISATMSAASFTNTRKTGNLTVSKTVESDLAADASRDFSFKVTLKDSAGAVMTSIGATTDDDQAGKTFGDAGDMTFKDGVATFTLRDGQSMKAVGLPSGVRYEVEETGASGFIATCANANNTGTIDHTGVTVSFTNTRAVCKITYGTNDGRTFHKAYASLAAAFEEVNSGTGALASASDIRVEMLLPSYTLPSGLTLNSGKSVTLTTAAADDADNYPGPGSAATIARGNFVASMLAVQGSLTLTDITLDGDNKAGVSADGALVNVQGTLNIGAGATLRNSVTTGKGSAVYVNGGTLNMSAGTITGNRSPEGAVATSSSGTLNFSGTATVSGNFLADGTTPCNVYLDQESETIFNTSGLSAGASVRVYIADAQELNHNHALDVFGSYTGDVTTTDLYLYRIVNDRTGMSAGARTDDHKLVWMKLATLAVTKRVNSPVATDAASRVFDFKMTLGEVMSTYTYYYKDGTAEYTFTEGESRSFASLKHGQTSDNNVKVPVNEAITITEVGADVALFSLTVQETSTNQFITGTPAIVTGENAVRLKLAETATAGSVMLTNSRYICKIVDGSGEHPFVTLNDALLYVIANIDNKTAAIEMLVDYAMPAADVLEIREGYDITLTTADKTGDGVKYKYTGGYPYAVITRISGYNDLDMFTVKGKSTDKGKLTFSGIVLDGNKGYVNAFGGIAKADDYGELVIAENATLRNSSTTSNGGAVFVDGGMLTMTGGAISGCEASNNGGAVYISSGATFSMSGGAVTGPMDTEGKPVLAAQNGGGVYVAGGGSFEMTGGMVNKCGAVNGSGVYVEANGTASLSGTTDKSPRIVYNEYTGSVSSAKGAGIYLSEGAALKLEGKLDFGSNYIVDSAYPGTGASAKKNGLDENAYKDGVRQDIYLAGYSAADAQSIILTGALDVDEGAIWVWAEAAAHYEMLKQFAVFDETDADLVTKTGTGDSATYKVNLSDNELSKTYKAFRNAQDDGVTGCGASYLTGSAGKVGKYIYWTGGFDFSFMKLDGFGEALPGATFALYTDADCQTALTRNGTAVTATSADGTDSYKDDDGQKLDKGIVYFAKLAPNAPASYYMVETEAPSADSKGYPVALNTMVYEVRIASDGDATVFTSARKATVTEVSGAKKVSVVNDPTGTPAEVSKAEVLNADGTVMVKKDADGNALKDDEGNAIPVYRYQIVNVSVAGRRVVLRKVEVGTYGAIEGAEFTLRASDGSVVADGLKSLSSGVIFAGTLPYGMYYLEETKVDPKYHQPEEGEYFRFAVNEKGVVRAADLETATNELLLTKGAVIGADGAGPNIDDSTGDHVVGDLFTVPVEKDGRELSLDEIGYALTLSADPDIVDFRWVDNKWKLYFKEAGKAVVTFTVKQDIWVDNVLYYKTGDSFQKTLTGKPDNKKAYCTGLRVDYEWTEGTTYKKNYGVSFVNERPINVPSVTARFRISGTVTSISGNVTASISGNVAEVTFNNYGNGLKEGETYSNIYMHVEGTSDFSLELIG